LGNGGELMRGYRDPDGSDEPESGFRFEDQFEHDGYSLTFRKYGRGRPVRVTPEERDDCIDLFERVDAHIQQIQVAAVIAWILGFLRWGDDGAWSTALGIAGPVIIVLLSWAFRRLRWTRTVHHFARRTPVGPERTLVDQYRSQALGLSWTTIGLVVVFSAISLWLVDFGRPADFLGAAHMGLALAGILALALLKVLSPRT
jgi:hypothetical protein